MVESEDQCEHGNLPSWILVDLNVHSIGHPDKSKFSHRCGCGKTISGESNTLRMVTSYLLQLQECLA
jgi:hypothetical protein